MTGHLLARLLKPFGVIPTPNAAGSVRGYHVHRLSDAWTRYLAPQMSERQKSNAAGPGVPDSERQAAHGDDVSKAQKSPANTQTFDALTHLKQECEEADDAGLF